MCKRILLDAGSGGRASHRLITELFQAHFANPILIQGDDAALLNVESSRLAISTDGHTVFPLFFPGGDIGRLAVYGTVNDVAMLGARPRWLTCAFIIEEGFEYSMLEAVVKSMAEAACECGVLVVGGDTKVVPRGGCDGLFITTTGVGEVFAGDPPSGSRARPGDAILISGPVGAHGLAILGAREGFDFLAGVRSDCAPVHAIANRLVEQFQNDIHVLRDPTRGGLATTVNEIAFQSGVRCKLDEAYIPVDATVRDGCSVLGLDPLYLANEGCLVIVVSGTRADDCLAVMRAMGLNSAARIGEVEPAEKGVPAPVLLTTRIGGQRVLPMLEGEPLPRIC